MVFPSEAKGGDIEKTTSLLVDKVYKRMEKDENGFQMSPPNLLPRRGGDSELSRKLIVKNIVKDHSYQWNAPVEGKQAVEGLGLWINPSKFRHKCIPNCMWYHLGDVMFIRAVVDIQKGDELTISYTGKPHISGHPDPTIGLDRWGITCNCPRCTYVKSGSTETVSWLDELEGLIDAEPSRRNFIRFNKFVDQIERDIKRLGSVVEVDAFVPLSAAASYFDESEEIDISLELYEKIYNIAKTNPYARSQKYMRMAEIAQSCYDVSDDLKWKNLQGSHLSILFPGCFPAIESEESSQHCPCCI